MVKVIAIVVTYHPDFSSLYSLLDSLRCQVDSILVVDNGSDCDISTALVRYFGINFEVMPLGQNLGIGAAQNRGIQWARNVKATHVVLFDHDSAPASDMVARLLD